MMVKLSRIAPELPVSDLGGAIRYYEQKLGFRVAMKMPAGNYAIVERDDVAIHLFRDDAQSSSPVGIHIFTEDLETLHTEL
jgi:catechol 2,3-dioxygenase-like lactoylglutathione lyase family enzyme